MSRTAKPDAVNTSKAGVNGRGDPYYNLAIAVVIQAIQDWRVYSDFETSGKWESSRPALSGVSLEELESFFLSRWCEDLLSRTDLNGDWILRRLKDENKRKQKDFLERCRPKEKPLSKKAQEKLARFKTMREMWAQGYSDDAIAGAVGVAKHTVECWRSVQSLPTNRAGIMDKLSEEEVEQRRRTP